MAASVNNIAGTFATVPITSSSSFTSSSSSSPNLPLLNQTNFPLSISHNPISTSWNPHTTLSKSHRSSLLNLYGLPGPPLLLLHHSISTVHHKPIPIGYKLPNVSLSYLTTNGTVQTTTLSTVCKGKTVVLIGASAAFSPSCTRFVRRVESEKVNGCDLIACVAVNDVFVVKAWGENLAVGEKVMMLSDGGGELCKAVGVALDTSGKACLGLGVRSRRFCLSVFNGVVNGVDFDEADDVFISTKSVVPGCLHREMRGVVILLFHS